MNLLVVQWTVDPTIFELGPLAVRWYGVLFAGAFLAGYYVMQHMLKREHMPKEWMDSLLIYVMVGTVLGARLGHVFFYQWDYYQDHLLEILQVWKGGLASHGAAIGIIVSLALWSWRVSKRSLLWILDRVVITVALGGVFIRTGNLMNHEIVGAVTESSSAFKFLRNVDDLGYSTLQQATGIEFISEDGAIMSDKLNEAYSAVVSRPDLAYVWELIPGRYPSQIMEAGSYLLIFLLLYAVYRFLQGGQRQGFIFGLFLVLLFSARFIIEFYKDVQVAFEESMQLNMGQWLSLPFVVAGVFFIVRALIVQPSARS